MLGNHPNIDPPLTVDQFGSPDVVHVLIAHLAVIGALVVESDLRLVVTHVDERSIRPVGHQDLGARRW